MQVFRPKIPLNSVNVKISNESKSREVTINIKRVPKDGGQATAPVTTPTSKSGGLDILKIASLVLNVILVGAGVYFYMQNKKTAKEGAEGETSEDKTEETKTEETPQNKEVKQEAVKETPAQAQVVKQEAQAPQQTQTAATTEAKPQQTATPQVNQPQVIESITDAPATTPPVKKRKVVINTSSIIKD